MGIKENIEKIIWNVLELAKDKKLGINDALEEFGLDSLNSIQLIVQLEETFNVIVPENMLNKETVSTIYNIIQLITEMKGMQTNYDITNK